MQCPFSVAFSRQTHRPVTGLGQHGFGRTQGRNTACHRQHHVVLHRGSPHSTASHSEEVTCEERSLHSGHRRHSGLEISLNQHLVQRREHSIPILARGALLVMPNSGLVTLNSGHPKLCLPLGFYNSWPSQSKCGQHSGVIFTVSSGDCSFRWRSNSIRYPGKNF